MDKGYMAAYLLPQTTTVNLYCQMPDIIEKYGCI